MSVKIATFCTIISTADFMYILVHKCRLKAGFPAIFEIISAKSEGGVKYICVLKSNLIIYIADYFIYTYMHTCRLKAAFHTRFVNF